MYACIIDIMIFITPKRSLEDPNRFFDNLFNKLSNLEFLPLATGETIKIVIEDYVQHLSRYHFKLTFDPELLFGHPFQYQNRIALEFNHLYHWHPLMPDNFVIGEIYILLPTDVRILGNALKCAVPRTLIIQ